MTPAATQDAGASVPGTELLQRLVAWDLQVDQAVRAWTADWSPLAVAAVASVSHLGDRLVLGLAAALACVAVALRGRPAPAVVAGALLAGQGLLVWALKDWAARARPAGGVVDLAWVVVNGHSLPSGHATATVVGYGLLAWLALHGGPRRWRDHRHAIVAAAATLAVAVGVSRVLLGAHYASDVLAGWALGTAWLLASLALLRRVATVR